MTTENHTEQEVEPVIGHEIEEEIIETDPDFISEIVDGYKMLPKKFRGRGQVKGFIFTRVLGNTKFFVYRVDGSGHKPHYEVFKRKINHMYMQESKPGSESFGVWAWSMGTFAEAATRFNELTKGIENDDTDGDQETEV